MKFGAFICVCILFSAVFAEFPVAFVDSAFILRATEAENFTCSANMFSSYLNSLIVDSRFPDECHTPPVDIFTSIDVIYIEEAHSLDETDDSAEMVITGANTMKATIESYHPAEEFIERICYNENAVGCPRSFEVVSNLTQLVIENKTVIYRPLHNESAIMEIEEITAGYNVLGFIALSEPNLYKESEIIDMNIIFVVVVLLLLVGAAAVIAVATIDYGEDTAGLYSKFKQDKTQ